MLAGEIAGTREIDETHSAMTHGTVSKEDENRLLACIVIQPHSRRHFSAVAPRLSWTPARIVSPKRLVISVDKSLGLLALDSLKWVENPHVKLPKISLVPGSNN
jgi:hypothetical protein